MRGVRACAGFVAAAGVWFLGIAHGQQPGRSRSASAAPMGSPMIIHARPQQVAQRSVSAPADAKWCP